MKVYLPFKISEPLIIINAHTAAEGCFIHDVMVQLLMILKGLRITISDVSRAVNW